MTRELSGDLKGAGAAPVPRLLQEAIYAALQRRMFGEAANAPILGHYRIVRPLGFGGFGTVYEAEDPRLERRVAIKVLSGDEQLGGEALTREARILAKLRHPHVIAVHDVGSTADGAVFLAMELVEGGTLRGFQARVDRPRRDVLAAYVHAGRGLQAIHEAGIVHGDFKPDNVLVGTDGEVRVADFGLARLRGPGAPMGVHATAGPLTTTVGTLRYMAPEQLRGGAGDARSDQFGFCVALFEALHRSHPFSDGGPDAVRAAIERGVVRKPRGGPRVPGWIDRVLERGLRADPDRRFSTMGSLLRELERDRARRWRAAAVAAAVPATLAVGWLMRGPVVGPPVACAAAGAALSEAWGEPRRQRLRAALLATGAGFAGDTWERLLPRIDAHASSLRQGLEVGCAAASIPTDHAGSVDPTVRCLARRISDFAALIQVLEAADREAVSRAIDAVSHLGSVGDCLDGSSSDARAAAADPAVGVAAEAARERLGRIRAAREIGHARAAGPEIEALAEHVRELGDVPLRVEVLYELGWVRWELGRFEPAAEAFETAALLGTGASMNELATLAAGRVFKALGREGGNDRAASERWAPEARAIAGLVPEHSPARAQYIAELAVLHAGQGDYAGAIARLEESLAIRRRVLEPGALDTIRMIHDIGTFEEARGDLDRAEELLRQALEAFAAALGPRHPTVGFAWHNLGLVTWRRERFADALVDLEHARAIWEDAWGADHAYVAVTHTAIARVHLSAGHPRAALVAAERAAAMLGRLLGDAHAFTAEAMMAVALARLELGQAELALAPAERALDVLAVRGEPEPRATARLTLARVLLALGGDRARADDLLDRAAAGFRELGPNGAAPLRRIDALASQVAAR